MRTYRAAQSRHHEACSILIVLGIAPGLQNLGYCIVSYKDDGSLPKARYRELLKGIWMRGATAPAELQKKAKAHRMVLDIVLERWQPVLIAVGPPALPKEPAIQVDAARFVLRVFFSELIGAGLPMRYIEWQTKEEIAAVLGLDEWRRVLPGRLLNAQGIKKPALQVAAATALAGGSVLLAEKQAKKTGT